GGTTADGPAGEILGGLGVVGPTFLDYSGTMSRVSAVAHYVSDILGHE
ncbi:MAG: heat-inducible transcriptional repressor HrcA, partial [Corynebacterium casei]|nr:heat-inducible transcriptional repressor HrcA [Corynebacterium casei]